MTTAIKKKTISASVLEATLVELKDLASRCDMSQGQAIDALMHYGRDKVIRHHSKLPADAPLPERERIVSIRDPRI